jgi:hypothetical protein
MNTTSKSGSHNVTVTLKVHSEDIKSFRDPNQLGRKRYVLQVPVEEIAKAAIEFGPNPRNQDMGTGVVKAIQETLEDKPAWFQYANKGILINAQAAEYDNKLGELRMSLNKDSQNPWGESLGGNMDGGHTQAVIIQKIRDNLWKNFENPKDKQWVNVEILTGIDFDQLSFIAGARNRSVAVKDLSLSVLNDELDWLIKDEFEKAGFLQEIAWRQNADGDITGEEVLVYLSLHNPQLTDKTRCYVGAGSIIKGLRSPEQMNGLKSAVAGKAVRWMKFVDHIHNSMEEWWIKYKGELGENARFGGLEGVQKVAKPHKLVFLKTEQDYRVAKSWLMPIAYGFATAFQQEQDDKLLQKVASEVGPRLMGNIYDITESENLNLNAVGKNKSAWTSSEALVQAGYMRLKFEALSQQRSK